MIYKKNEKIGEEKAKISLNEIVIMIPDAVIFYTKWNPFQQYRIVFQDCVISQFFVSAILWFELMIFKLYTEMKFWNNSSKSENSSSLESKILKSENVTILFWNF